MKLNKFASAAGLAFFAYGPIATYAYTEALYKLENSSWVQVPTETGIVDNLGIFTTDISPVPRVSFTASPYNYDSPSSAYFAEVTYEFTVKGAPNTSIPVGFSGLVNIKSTGQLEYSPVLANFHIGSQSTQEYANGLFYVSALGFGAGLGIVTPNNPNNRNSVPWTFLGSTSADSSFAMTFKPGSADTVSSDEVTNTEAKGVSYGRDNWVSGRFLGELGLVTSAEGVAKGKVTLNISGGPVISEAYDQDGTKHSSLGSSLYGMIDPYLFIDPSYLVLNPYTTLSVESDVGNAAPVPEPESYVMLLAGLGLIGGFSRRKMK